MHKQGKKYMGKNQISSNSPLSLIMPFLETMILPPLCLESFTLWDSTYCLNNWNPSSAFLLCLPRFFFLAPIQNCQSASLQNGHILQNSFPQLFWMIPSFLICPLGGAPLPGKGRASPTLNLYFNSAQMLQHRAKDLVKVLSKIVFSKPQFDSHMPPNNHTLAIIMIFN